MPPAQITEAFSKGVVNGAMAPYEVVPAVKLDEVTKYHMDSPAGRPGFSQNPLVMLMNKQKYTNLAPELRAVVDKHSGLALAEMAGASWDQANEEARKMLIAHGNKVLTIKDEDYDAMRAATASIEKEWAAEIASRGVGGAKLAAEARAIGAKHIRPSRSAAMAEAIDDADREMPVVSRGYAAVLEKLTLAFAIAGGLVSVGLVGMSLVSIVGRKLASAPVQGDVELMQMGAAVGTAAFLPLCTSRDHHIKVDALTGWLPGAGRSLLDAMAQLLLLAVASVMTWWTALAAIDTHSAGEMSPLLLIPRWIPVAMLVPSLLLFALCAAFRVGLSVQTMLRGSQP